MDRIQFKKEVQQLVKKYSLEIIHINGLNCKFKAAGFQSLIFMNKKKELGELQYSYVSNRFSDIGSLFGFSVGVTFRKNEFFEDDVPEQFQLLKLLTGWDLSYENRCIASDCFFGFSSLNTLSKDFYNKGRVSFFENDLLDEKVKQIVSLVNTIYVPRIERFLFGKIELLDDIFEYPYNFGYPLATALAVCKLNNREDLFCEIIKRSENHKRMQFELPLLDEVYKKMG